MEPPNNGHIGTRHFILYREVHAVAHTLCGEVVNLEHMKENTRGAEHVVCVHREHITYNIHNSETSDKGHSE